VTHALLASLALLLCIGSAQADETQSVRPSATVEVLDDKAQIDDVISRLKSEPVKTPPKSEPQSKRFPTPQSGDKELKRRGKGAQQNRLQRERLERARRRQ
jgi:hypothetical protein